MTGTICCPGCGVRVDIAAVVCNTCREFLPGTVRADLAASVVNVALVPIMLPAVLNAVAVRPVPAKGRAGAPRWHGGNP